MIPSLNWREIARCAEWASQALVGTHLDRIYSADRREFPEGYLKNEWYLRFSDRKREGVLALSVRPRACYFTVTPGKGRKPSSVATRSPFDQALSKHLKGRRLTGLRAIERERFLVLEFEGNASAIGPSGEESLWLIVALIPALPEAVLVRSQTLEILARSRTIREVSRQTSRWSWPDGQRSAPELSIREELVSSMASWSQKVEESLHVEAMERRVEIALREIRDRVKVLKGRLKQSIEEEARAQAEPLWGELGEKLKQWLYALPPSVQGFWHLDGVAVPCGEGKSPSEQLEKLFNLERRRRRRLEEARSRADWARGRLLELEPWLVAELQPERDLAGLERAAGVVPLAVPSGPASKSIRAPGGVPARWNGRTYYSREGLPILVGKSRDENLELTFKIAKGNDLWMHVRGRPGAHVVVPLPSGRSASLETLLDAAQLAVFHSGGKNWGKTEVDYTFKKYVKRIKDSSEASYTQNKTLLVAPDSERLNRLMGSQTE